LFADHATEADHACRSVRVVVTFIQLGTLVLARLLSPENYGLVSMVTAITVFAPLLVGRVEWSSASPLGASFFKNRVRRSVKSSDVPIEVFVPSMVGIGIRNSDCAAIDLSPFQPGG
jgi:hypothetical protein